MSVDVFMAHLLATRGGVVGNLASAFMVDDAVAGMMLNDFLQDHLEETMSIFDMLEIGKVYLFKTYGMFYEGVVKDKNSAAVRLRNVKLVVDQGNVPASYENKKYDYSEDFPKNKDVILSSIHVYAVEER